MRFKRLSSCLVGVSLGCGLIMAGTAQAGIQIEHLRLLAANDTQSVAAAETSTGVGAVTTGSQAATGVKTAQAGSDIPTGVSPGKQPSLLPKNAGIVNQKNVFGSKGGFLHPYVSIKEEYTDNLYNLNSPKTSNWLTTLAPGIWFALPRKNVIPIDITPHNSSPGGLQQQLKRYSGTDRYLAYALGEIDFLRYSSNSDLNTTNGTLEGLFRYNMRGGLSLQAVDRFTRGADRFDIGTVPQYYQGRYKSNFVMATADWQMTDKLRAKLDYSNFNLKYDKSIDAFKTRTDNAIDLYGYYTYSVKTSFFLEDQYINVSYDSATQNDSKQNFIYGGMNWNTTEKLSLMAKAGMQTINYDHNITNSSRNDYRGLALDVQALYKWTPKTQFHFDVYRSNQETDSTQAAGKTVTGVKAEYEQKYTDKLTGNIWVTYEDDNYQQLVSQDRDDKEFVFQPFLQYKFREWMMVELSYTFDKRDSTDNLFDFQTNTIMATLKFAM